MFQPITWQDDGGTALNKRHFNKNEENIQNAVGINFDMQYNYARNCYTIAICDSIETWGAGSWISASGSDSYNAINYRLGASSKSIAITAIGQGAYLVKNMDLSKSIGGFTMDNDDYIKICIYVDSTSYGNMLANSYMSLLFHNDNYGTVNNYAYYTFVKGYTMLNGSWAFTQIKKSQFTQVGSFSWANIKGLSIMSGGAVSSGFTVLVDAIHMVRKDWDRPNYAAPFQINWASEQYSLIYSEGNKWHSYVSPDNLYLGMDNTGLICKILNDGGNQFSYSNIFSFTSNVDFKFKYRAKIKEANLINCFSFGVSNQTCIRFEVVDSYAYCIVDIDRQNITTQSKSWTSAVNEIWNLDFIREGNNFTITLYQDSYTKIYSFYGYLECPENAFFQMYQSTGMGTVSIDEIQNMELIAI